MHECCKTKSLYEKIIEKIYELPSTYRILRNILSSAGFGLIADLSFRYACCAYWFPRIGRCSLNYFQTLDGCELVRIGLLNVNTKSSKTCAESCFRRIL